MNYYKEFTITAEPFIPDVISSLLWELEITGITEEINCLKVFTAADSGINASLITDQLQKLVNEKMLFKFNVEEYLLEEKNWNEEWEKNINVIEATDKIVIRPTFREYKAKEGQIVLVIDPKMSFGTGEHQTTKLVLVMEQKYIKKNMNIIDIGSGTGILSIAAIKLGANSAVAVDNDEWCTDNAIENSRLNEVQERVTVIKGEIKDISGKKFDMVMANIQKNILINIAGQIREKTADNGIVILSGLLLTDEDDILNTYKNYGFKLLEKSSLDEWICLVLV